MCASRLALLQLFSSTPEFRRLCVRALNSYCCFDIFSKMCISGEIFYSKFINWRSFW
jgi:hypothetical protein